MRTYDDDPTKYQDLRAGRIDAVLNDRLVAADFVRTSPESRRFRRAVRRPGRGCGHEEGSWAEGGDRPDDQRSAHQRQADGDLAAVVRRGRHPPVPWKPVWICCANRRLCC
ncbi:hypothetical protein ACRAWD_15600 [Caulobacter segnis]